jgi:hypothetical protein
VCFTYGRLLEQLEGDFGGKEGEGLWIKNRLKRRLKESLAHGPFIVFGSIPFALLSGLGKNLPATER